MRDKIRFETYNTFNRRQLTPVDTVARFDTPGSRINPDFGAYTATGRARVMQPGINLLF